MNKLSFKETLSYIKEDAFRLSQHKTLKQKLRLIFICLIDSKFGILLWFRSSVLAQFEDFKAKLPIGVHEYLTHVYGDYMKLPPKEKQVSHHCHYYVNLEKHVPLEQILQTELT